MTDERPVRMNCILCGTRFDSPQTAIGHPAVCQPRWWYWWPRAYPYRFAACTLTVGLFVGYLLGSSPW